MAGSENKIVLEWYSSSIEFDKAILKDSPKECLLTVVVPNFQVKGLLTKQPVDGKLSVNLGSDSISFTFHIARDPDPVLQCRVSNLPGKIIDAPSPKVQDGYIILTLKKEKKQSWDSMPSFDIAVKEQDKPML